MSCSSKRNTAAGSCISTFVSRTNARRAPFAGRFFSIASEFPRSLQDLGGVPLDPHLAPLAADRAPWRRSGTCCARGPSSCGRTCSSVFHAPNSDATAWSSSEPSSNGNFILSLNLRCDSSVVGRDAEDAACERGGMPARGRGSRCPRACSPACCRAGRSTDQILRALVAEPERAGRGREAELRRLRARLARRPSPQFLTGSRIASRFIWSQKSMNSSRSAPTWMRDGTLTTM